MTTKLYVLDRREDDGSVVDIVKIKRLHLGLNKMMEVHGLKYHIPMDVVIKYMNMPRAELQIKIDGKVFTILTTSEYTDHKTMYDVMLEMSGRKPSALHKLRSKVRQWWSNKLWAR